MTTRFLWAFCRHMASQAALDRRHRWVETSHKEALSPDLWWVVEEEAISRLLRADFPRILTLALVL
jgi:hypothetical protein